MGDNLETTMSSDDNLIEDNSNKHRIMCERCSSVILLPKKAKIVNKMIFLPHMKKKNVSQAPNDGEMLERFWAVDDMFIFENVGFSNTVDGVKYLICADCEIGPIGYHDTKDTKAFYVSFNRVKYECM